MAFVIGILKATHDGTRCPNKSRKLSLGEVRVRPHLSDLASDFFVCPDFFQALYAGWLAFIKPAVKDLHSIGSGLFVLTTLSLLTGVPLRTLHEMLPASSALSVSFGGTTSSFIMPWDTTAATFP